MIRSRRLFVISVGAVMAAACAPSAPTAPKPAESKPAEAKPAEAKPAAPVAVAPTAAPAAPPKPTEAPAPKPAAKVGPAQMTETGLLGSWFPQPEEGGYYLAENEGLFKSKNVNLTIKSGGPGVDVVKLVATGQYKFGMGISDQIALARNEGVPVVALAGPIQKYIQIIMVHEESGIKTFEDIGKGGNKVAVSSSAQFVQFLRKKYGWKEEQILRYNGQIAEWLQDKQRGTQGIITNEPFLAKQQGANARALLIADLSGYNPYQKMLFTTEDVLKKEPDLVAAVIAGSIEGWKAYVENGDKTNEYLKSKNRDLDEEQMKYSYGALKPFVTGGDAEKLGIGAMTQARWDEIYAQLKDLGLIKPDQQSKDAWSEAALKPFLKT
jgi:NitT/TauT family transport system substrate-binding protein